MYKLTLCIIITLDTRLPFPDSVRGMFPGPATIQKVYQGIVIPAGGATMIDGFEHVEYRALGRITAGDWHSGWPGRILRNSLLTEGKILSKHEDSALKHNCNVMMYMYIRHTLIKWR